MPRADTPAPARSYRISAALAIALLAAQMILPWSVPLLITQDGPSHLYTATIARDLVFHGGSVYGTVYHLQPLTNPNWATTVALGAMSMLVGIAHAERLLMSVCLLLGFLAFSYAARAFEGRAAWSPLANFLVQTWFLWIGYYNFYLGMVLCLFIVGFFLRHVDTLGWPRALLIAAGGIAQAMTHPVPAALAIMTLALIAIWTRRWRTLTVALLSLSPAMIMLLLFARAAHAPSQYIPDTWRAFTHFPMQAFATAGGDWGEQRFVWPVVLFTIVVGIALLRREEWRGPRGALAVVTGLCFAGYLLLPDQGFGGGEAKIRFAWATFLFGALTVSSAHRLRRVQTPLAILLAAALAANLVVTLQTARALSNVGADYLAATSMIPRGARFVRLRYHTPTIPWRYGFSGNWSDPLLHLDAYVAASNQSIDLSDWQQANPVFSVSLNRNFTSQQRKALWSLEHPFPDGAATLRQLRQTLSTPIEYVVVVGEPMSGADCESLTAELDATMRLASTSRNQFVRVYQNK